MSNIKYKTKEDKIGETRLNKRGTLMKLIGYRNTHDCDVEFQDDYKYIFEHANYQNFLKGQIANPYDKTTYGIGMIGHGKYLTKIKNAHTTWYKCWVDVIRRCYIDKENFPAYYEISTICDEWLIFQNFAEWYHNNWYEIPNNERLHIDKDILVPGNKCYSPETCVFVPQKINMLFTNTIPTIKHVTKSSGCAII